MRGRLEKLERLFRKGDLPVIVVKYIAPGLPEPPDPPEEAIRAAIAEAKRNRLPAAVVYVQPNIPDDYWEGLREDEA